VKRRLVFISPRFLFPVDSGGKIRTTQILRGLKGGAFRITLAAPANGEARTRFADELDSVCDEFVSWRETPRSALFAWLRLRHVLSPLPIPVMTDRSPSGEFTVGELLMRAPDVVVFDFPHAAVLAPTHCATPSVMFTHNVEAEIFARHAKVAANPLQRWLWTQQHRKMVRFEQSTLARFDTVIAVSDRDAEHFRTAYGTRNVQTINTGVDLEYFDWSQPSEGAEVIFSGSMDWLANQDGIAYLMDQVWPHIARARPEAQMTIVGRAPPNALVAEARHRGLNWLFTGYVDDIRDYIRRAAVYAIPLRVGGGTRLKVFEAMSIGCPVVSTSVGVEGLPLEPDTHYLQADAPLLFARAVLRLLDDSALRLQLSRAARHHVESRFSFRSVAQEFESICLATAQASRAARIASVPEDLPSAAGAPLDLTGRP
jgi:glycosyltransferase involved in cell wall biosynthesis